MLAGSGASLDRLAGPVEGVLEHGQHLERVLVQLVGLGRDTLEARERASRGHSTARRALSRIAPGWPLRTSRRLDDIEERCRFRAVEGSTARTPEEFEERFAYGSERAEEARAVRVGEERSEAAAIVARYADLFTREQLDRLRAHEDEDADDVERERFHRLRKSCEGGLLARELVHLQDEVQNELLAIRVEYRGEEMPLRNAQAKLAVLDAYDEREELGEIHADATATMNERSSTSLAPRRSCGRS